MPLRVPLKVPPAMTMFWRGQESRNEPLSIMYAIQHQADSQQPIGYIQGYSRSKEGVTLMMKNYVNEYPKAKVKLIAIHPNV